MIPRRLERSRGQKRRIVRRIVGGLEAMESRVLLSSATFAVTSDWGSGFGGQITIANTQSTAVNNWTLVVQLGPLDHPDLGRDDFEPCRQSLRD